MNPYIPVVHKVIPFLFLLFVLAIPGGHAHAGNYNTDYGTVMNSNATTTPDGTDAYAGFSGSSYAIAVAPAFPLDSGSVTCSSGSSLPTSIDITFRVSDQTFNNCNTLFPRGTYVTVIVRDNTPQVSWFSGTLGGSDWAVGDPTNPPSCLAGDVGTCINTVTPSNNDTVSTTTPFDIGSDGYITTTDFATGSRLMIKIDRNQDQQAVGALAGFDSAFGNKYYIPISTSGSYNVSTTSESLPRPWVIGMYNVRWEIQSPKFSLFGFDLFYGTKASYNSRFIVGTTTAIDNVQLNQEKYLGDLAQSVGDPLASCQFSLFSDALDFSLGGKLLNCAGALLQWAIVPPAGSLETMMQQLKNGFLTRPPIGYVTRVVSVIASSSPSTLPVLSASIPTSADPDENINISFDLGDMVNGASSLQDTFVDPEGHTAQQILEPIIKVIVGLLVLMFIYKDITRF